MTSGTGSALSAASCDEVFYGRLIGYYANCFQGPWPSPELDESQRDLVPRKQAIEYTKDHLRRLPLVVAAPRRAAVGCVQARARPPRSTGGSRAAGARRRGSGCSPTTRCWPFAIFGLVMLRRRRIPILPLVAIAVIATFAAAITFGVTRYRAPAEVALVVAAAIGIAAAWTQLARPRLAPRGDRVTATLIATESHRRGTPTPRSWRVAPFGPSAWLVDRARRARQCASRGC